MEFSEWANLVILNNFNLINTLFYLIPAISPILMRTKTNRFDSLKYPTIFGLIIFGMMLFYFRISIAVSSILILFYSIMVSLGILVFMRKYDFIKSLSLSVALGFAASGLWEIPIITYTIFYKGYIDGAFPIHLLFILPLLLLLSDIRIEVSRRNILTALFIMAFNYLMLVIHIQIHGPNIWVIRGYGNNIFLWLSRLVTTVTLYSIYYGGEYKR